LSEPADDQIDQGGALPPAFATGEVLAGRYRVVSFLARGRTGDVYEVDDLEQGERVALKTVHPEIAGDRRVLARLKQQIVQARKVVHPNVCRIYDLGQDRRPGSDSVLTFLTMELLPGETLLARLSRSGPLPFEKAAPLIEGMARGLAAAHAAGIVHRDLEPGHVMLVPQPDRGIRPVITALGFARNDLTEATAALFVPDTRLVQGAAAYLAPEQVEGVAVTPAADLYALGAVMYEMATGVPPFRGETPLATAVKRLTERPTRPRERAANVDPRWEAVIMRCLARSPADRFRDANDVIRALRGEEVAPPRTRVAMRRVVAVAAGIAVIVGVAALGLRLARRGAGTARRPTVAVMSFRSLSGGAGAWLSTSLPEMLSVELSAGGRLRSVPGAQVARMKNELHLPEDDELARDLLARIRGYSAADFVVLGSYAAASETAPARIRLDVRVQDTQDGKVILSISETGKESDLFDLAARVGEGLRRGLRGGSVREKGALRASFPVSLEAARLYSEGLAALRADDALRARDLLERSHRIEGDKALVRAALGEVWWALGYEAKARDLVHEAWEVAGDLSHERRLEVEARYYEFARGWDQAAELYRTLSDFFPDELEYSLRLAAARRQAGHAREALKSLQELEGRVKVPAHKPRIELEQAFVAESLSDWPAELAAAGRASANANAIGARLLEGQARLAEAAALEKLGDLAQARERYGAAKAAFEDVSNRTWAAEATRRMALLAWREGDGAETKRLGELALQVFREAGDERAVGATLGTLGLAYAQSKDFAHARDLYQEALDSYRRVGDKPHLVATLTSLGDVWVAEGELGHARPVYEEALDRARGLEDKEELPRLLKNLAEVARLEAELPSARKLYDEALTLFEQNGQKSGLAFANLGLGQVLAEQGDFAEARKLEEQSLALRRELGETRAEGISRVALAALTLEEGRSAEAEALARETIGLARESRSDSVLAAANEVLARALLAQGRLGEARAAVDEATAAEAAADHVEVPGRIRLTAARIRGAMGEPEAQLSELAAQLDRARKAGLAALQLEVRLALGELEIASGRNAAGRMRLQTVEKEAATLGFAQLAKKAAVAREAQAIRSPRPSPSSPPKRRAGDPVLVRQASASARSIQASSAAFF
jgi:eukaryotic-like serine/threonine-protein kinase